MHPATVADLTPEKPAIIIPESGEHLSYRELADQSSQLARVLRRAGMTVGDRVAILMTNNVRYVTACWAARRIGLFYVPINWHLTVGEMQFILEDSRCTALISNVELSDLAAELRRRCRSIALAVSVDERIEGFDLLGDLIAGVPTGRLEDEIEGQDIIYTSGTTGRPKGGTKGLTGMPPGEGDSERTKLMETAYGLSADTVYLTPGAPMYHAAPLRYAIKLSELGATHVLMRRFDAEGALAAIERYRVDTTHFVPTMFVRLLRLPPERRNRYDLSSHRLSLHGAAPCPLAVKDQMIEWWGPILTEYYGASEGGAVTAITSAEWQLHRGSVGKPHIGVIHVLDGDGNVLPPGEPGALYFENASPVRYLGDEEQTRGAHNERGWSTVGDVGYLDADGYLYLTDRKDHMIVSGGINIYPREAEDVLIQHTAIADVAVIGVPSDEYGQEVKAVVQLEDSTCASEHLATEIVEFCRERLARYKCPRSVDFVDQLPRTSAGKLYKRRLMDHYWEGRDSRVV